VNVAMFNARILENDMYVYDSGGHMTMHQISSSWLHVSRMCYDVGVVGRFPRRMFVCREVRR
jgi:hypothetical protein